MFICLANLYILNYKYKDHQRPIHHPEKHIPPNTLVAKQCQPQDLSGELASFPRDVSSLHVRLPSPHVPSHHMSLQSLPCPLLPSIANVTVTWHPTQIRVAARIAEVSKTRLRKSLKIQATKERRHGHLGCLRPVHPEHHPPRTQVMVRQRSIGANRWKNGADPIEYCCLCGV